MENRNIQERRLKTFNGLVALVLIIAVLVLSIALFICGAVALDEGNYAGAIALVASAFLFIASLISFNGLKVLKPNEALVLSLFGKYHGTIYEAGYHFVNPFCSPIYPRNRDEEAAAKMVEASKNNKSQTITVPKKVSTKLSTFVNGNQKVNDKLGNPVEVSAIVIWKVVDATKAVINVDNYTEYLSSQTDSTIRNVARLYPYDIVSDGDDGNAEADETTLRGSAVKIANEMKEELEKRVENAGIDIIEVRLNQIAYATEIAAAMLQRQQAVAIIAARKKIVEGAVSMVEMALEKLKEDGVVDLDEERKAQMVSNLLVVLCGNKEANPVLNTGSIY
ncbi:MAG: SPFH domain-containing protein [Sphaerochaetaceae bacterium]|nr:SPFH domain-containing protein [Sphaerochaetaceae bacterium]